MKKLLFLCLTLLSLTGFSQYGNQWINYSQKYYKIKIINNGIYRIDSSTLANAGIDLSVVNPKNLQIFNREKEQFIYIEGEQDNQFNNGDYIEFYGMKNDAWLDTLLYGSKDSLPDLYLSLYNDTATYFLTYNGSTNNKRIKVENDNNFGAYTPASFYWAHSFYKYQERYYAGPQFEGASSPFFQTGEGYYSDFENAVSGGFTFVTPVSTPNAYTGAGAPDAWAEAVSASNSHSLPIPIGNKNHHLRLKYGNSNVVVMDTTFSGYKMIKRRFTIPPSAILSSIDIKHELVDDQGVNSDFQCVASATIHYAHDLNLSGANTSTLFVPFNSSESKSYYTLTNFGGPSAIMYVMGDSVKRIIPQQAGSTLDVLIPNDVSTNETKVYLSSTSSIINVSSLKPVNGTGTFTDYASLNIDSAYLIISHPSLNSSVQQYANYRSSAAGGSHNVLVVNSLELYDQYAAGISKHVLGIKRFCDHMINSWPGKPAYLFLIGKSVREASEGLSLGSKQDPGVFMENLVPSFGYPSSDNLITGGLDGTYLEPAIPTGRLSAKTNQHVLDYLEKVEDYEGEQNNNFYTKADKDWMKHILHFGGGGNESEQIEFKGYLQNFENIIEDTSFGGSVQSFFKTSSQPIDPVDFQVVNQRITEGVSLMTFFGHGSINGFDQNVDEIQNWSNYKKYPLLIGNSCFSGDIHQPGNASVSEEFTLFPDKGVIGFIATVKLGFITPLRDYTTELYEQFSRYSYNKSIGLAIKNAVDSVQSYGIIYVPGSVMNVPPIEVYTGMTLHGDPALKLNTHEYPEFILDQSDVYFTPNDITLAADSFDVNIVINNLGKAVEQNFSLILVRHFPNGADSTYIKTIPSSYYKDTVTFRLPTQHNIAFGQNQFDISIDLPSVIQEQYDDITNNQISVTLSINGNAIYPVYPYDYAVVPDSAITFKASTLNPLSPAKNYRFEIDTTDLFNSPMLHYKTINSPGGVVNVPYTDWIKNSTGSVSPLMFTDSTVYFWRVSPDSTTYIWQERSFQYIPGKEGWGQAHFFQFEDNTHTHINYERPLRKWTYDNIVRKITVNVTGYLTSSEPSSVYFANNWSINGDIQEASGNWYFPGLVVGVYDPYNDETWASFHTDGVDTLNPDKNFGGVDVRPWRPDKYFIFNQNNPTHLDSLVSMINQIPCGMYYTIYTYSYADYSEWDAHSPDVYTMFQSLGFDSIYQGREETPFIVIGRKCDPSANKFIIGDTITEDLTLNDSLEGYLPGNYRSVKIGPAYNWNNLYWAQHALETSPGDSSRLQVIGISATGIETLMIDTILTNKDSILNLNSIVNASQYPYLRLKATLFDNVNQTPAWMERWQVLYDPAPEAAINPQLGYYFSLGTDSIAEGDEMQFAIAIENISPYDMDSLLVHYWVTDANNQRNYLTYTRQDSLKAGEVLLDTITINTTNFPGLNELWIEANPVPLNATIPVYDQLEQYHFNNFAKIPFTVSEDITNPILDVTFDGIHILNGDIVSAKPFIVMTLDDENPYLLMNETADTAKFVVYVTNPAGMEERVYFMNGAIENMKFIPAGSDNKVKIEYSGNFPVDGKYTLRVKGWDKSDNKSGIDYKIEFEVVNKSSITEIMNWPNPFTTQTKFVFTLTGSVLPQNMIIQIMTVSGKVVREITMDELGPIHIGRNITEYAWDGTDEFGDRLANGVYFYHVITKLNGGEIEKRESGADQFFRKGFGKMYLMR